jgi:Prenylcysteine lyase
MAPLSSFEWHESLWYTGAIEAIGSSLDLALATGMNVATLVLKQLKDSCAAERKVQDAT